MNLRLLQCIIKRAEPAYLSSFARLSYFIISTYCTIYSANKYVYINPFITLQNILQSIVLTQFFRPCVCVCGSVCPFYFFPSTFYWRILTFQKL